MSAISLKEITVELLNPSDGPLEDVSHLTLECSLNGNVMSTIKLSSHISTAETQEANKTHPSIWSTDENVNLSEQVSELEISAWVELHENQRQLIASTQLNGHELYNTIGNQYEVPMMRLDGHPNLVLKTRVVQLENIGALATDIGQKTLPQYGEDTIHKLLSESISALYGFQQEENISGVEQAIPQLKSATSVIPEDNPNLSALLSTLGACLASRYAKYEQLTDLDDAVAQFRLAVNITPDGHDNKPVYLNNLASTHLDRFTRSGNRSDLDDAISIQQKAVDLTPDNHPKKLKYLKNLEEGFQTRFDRFGNVDDYRNAIS
ncbi:hypothetical protein CPB86DRAFT_768993, partial [Serendipita vermifera]